MTSRPDPLAVWWIHPVQVERYTGQDPFGEDRYAPAKTVTGLYRDGESVARTAAGDDAAAAGRFAYPHDVATIPLKSRLTLPAAFDGPDGPQVVFVEKSNVADGPAGTPEHKIVEVK